VVTSACLAGFVATGFAPAETSKTIENYRLHMFDVPFRSLVRHGGDCAPPCNHERQRLPPVHCD
jgi:hypothetical protein